MREKCKLELENAASFGYTHRTDTFPSATPFLPVSSTSL